MGALEDTKEQLIELKKLREAHRRRLSVLQVQAAQFGYETPPAITTEMEDIDRQLTSINQKISLLAGAMPAQLEQLGPVVSPRAKSAAGAPMGIGAPIASVRGRRRLRILVRV